MAKMRDKISVIIPAYNCEKYITRCLHSVLSQTYGNWEAIVIDDGSIDGTFSLAEKIANGDDRIKIFHTENSGVSSARNQGLMRATGKYICFLDADDCLRDDCFSIIVNELHRKQDVDILQFSFQMLREGEMQKIVGTNEQKKYSSKLAIKMMFKGNKLNRVVWGNAYRSDLLFNIKFEEKINLGEDMLFQLEAVSKARNVLCIDEEVYFNYIHEDSLSRHPFNKQDINNTLVMLECIKSRFSYEEEIDRSRAEYTFETCMAWLNRILICCDIDNFADEISSLRNLLNDMLKKYKIRPKKKYAYVVYKLMPNLYNYLIDRYYRRGENGQ